MNFLSLKHRFNRKSVRRHPRSKSSISIDDSITTNSTDCSDIDSDDGISPIECSEADTTCRLPAWDDAFLTTKVVLTTQSGEAFHTSVRNRPRGPALKKSARYALNNNDGKSMVVQQGTRYHARFVDEALNLGNGRFVATEIRTRPRTSLQEKLSLFYNARDIREFRSKSRNPKD